MSVDTKVIVTRATFAELSKALAVAGCMSMLAEDGTIRCGDIVITDAGEAERCVKAARTAQVIDDLSVRNNATYSDERTEVSTYPDPAGVRVVERTNGSPAREVVLPHDSLVMVASDLIECIGRH